MGTSTLYNATFLQSTEVILSNHLIHDISLVMFSGKIDISKRFEFSILLECYGLDMDTGCVETGSLPSMFKVA